ncbi:7-cyano-7-deazaguanine synthase [Cellulosilyticum lentocellum]
MLCIKSIVLFSGGIDSTTCLALAIENFSKENVTPLSITYG